MRAAQASRVRGLSALFGRAPAAATGLQTARSEGVLAKFCAAGPAVSEQVPNWDVLVPEPVPDAERAAVREEVRGSPPEEDKGAPHKAALHTRAAFALLSSFGRPTLPAADSGRAPRERIPSSHFGASRNREPIGALPEAALPAQPAEARAVCKLRAGLRGVRAVQRERPRGAVLRLPAAQRYCEVLQEAERRRIPALYPLLEVSEMRAHKPRTPNHSWSLNSMHFHRPAPRSNPTSVQQGAARRKPLPQDRNGIKHSQFQ